MRSLLVPRSPLPPMAASPLLRNMQSEVMRHPGGTRHQEHPPGGALPHRVGHQPGRAGGGDGLGGVDEGQTVEVTGHESPGGRPLATLMLGHNPVVPADTTQL